MSEITIAVTVVFVVQLNLRKLECLLVEKIQLAVCQDHICTIQRNKMAILLRSRKG